MTIEILELTIQDYDDAIALWESCSGVSIRDADSRENIARYLNRNQGLSFKAVKNKQVYEVDQNIWFAGGPLGANKILDDLFKYLVKNP